MNAKDFKEVNVKIAEHQEEYQTLPAKFDKHESGLTKITTCWQLDLDEISQIQKTGMIWLQQLSSGAYPPILTTCLKPKDVTQPKYIEE